MWRKKFFELTWVLAVLATGIYFLGRLSLQLYNGKFKLKETQSAAANTEAMPKPFAYQHAITIEVGFFRDRRTITTKQPVSLKKILQQISVTGSTIKTCLADGIENGHIVISNKSNYLVEQVQIQIDYLRSNGDIIFSKIISVNGLKPSSKSLVFVPHSKRGMLVKYKVMNIYIPLQNAGYNII